MSGINVKKKIETKDWVYLFIISLFLQFIIYYFSFAYGGSVKALGYVSFAGTLISIILAVIAIGYTYGESIKQKTASDQLLFEIAGLREIKDKLAGQVNILENIAEIKTDIKDTKDAVNKIDLLKQFKILTEDLDKLEEKTSIPTIGLDKIEQIIMSFKMIADGYILELAEVMDKMETDDLTDILVAVVKPDYEDDEWIDILNLYAGIYYMAENLGIFKDLKVQNGIKDIYRKKYPKNTDKMKPDSRFAKLIQKALYT